MKYSIIIPIYNAEKTLHRCLDSLIPQINNDIEILLINDGSSDSSCEICKEYLNKNNSFRYYYQENSGVSAARNKGLDNANGDYILFVDSDDYVDIKYLETIDSCIEKDKPEMMIFSVTFLNRDGKNVSMSYDDMSCSGKEMSKQLSLLGKKQKMHSLWNKVFINQIIKRNNIRFYPDLQTGEDSIFVFHYSFFITRLITKSNILYYVDETSQNSLSRKKRKDLSKQLILASKHSEDTLAKVPLDERKMRKYKKRLSRGYYRGAYSCFLDASKGIDDKSELNKEISRICLDYKNNRIKPIGLEATVMSLPVLLNFRPIIRLIINIKNIR